MIYQIITTDLTEAKRLEVDEILGSRQARARINELRRETAAMAGFEVG